MLGTYEDQVLPKKAEQEADEERKSKAEAGFYLSRSPRPSQALTCLSRGWPLEI